MYWEAALPSSLPGVWWSPGSSARWLRLALVGSVVGQAVILSASRGLVAWGWH
jgi:hypothetical protein